mmetsp:Transcript_16661/g.20956  ORF Transcript_16661/g.20956 Transcript_16661/m.20956 type:complete len:286 (+) Transcript_16661:100-957(+)
MVNVMKNILRKDPFLRFCRHVVQNKVCERRRCPFVHNLELKIPCPYYSCKFGPGVCVYQHNPSNEDFLKKFDDMKAQFLSHLELMWSYQFAAFKWEIRKYVEEKRETGCRDGDDSNEVLCFVKPRVDDPVVIEMQKSCVSTQLIQPLQDTKGENVIDDKTMTEEEFWNLYLPFRSKGEKGRTEEKVNDEIILEEKSQTAALVEEEKEETRRCFCGGNNCPVCRGDLGAEEQSMEKYFDKFKQMHVGGERVPERARRGRGAGRKGRGRFQRGRGRRGRPPPPVEKW